MKINDLWVKGIPITEYMHDVNPPKGLFFVVHGHTQSRNTGLRGLIDVLTRNHYLTVTVDAYKHGERKEEPYLTQNETALMHAMPHVVHQTILDIQTLYETTYKTRFSTFGIAGFSMGAHLAYYAPMFIDNIHTIIPIAGSPNLINHYRYTVKKRILELDESILDVFKAHYDLSRLQNINVLILHGRQDQVVLIDHAVVLKNKLKERNHPDVTFVQLECGHELVDEMFYAINLYLRMHP